MMVESSMLAALGAALLFGVGNGILVGFIVFLVSVFGRIFESTMLQELEWHLFALIFLLGAAYTLKHDEHVRVDVLYQARWMTPRRRGSGISG